MEGHRGAVFALLVLLCCTSGCHAISWRPLHEHQVLAPLPVRTQSPSSNTEVAAEEKPVLPSVPISNLRMKGKVEPEAVSTFPTLSPAEPVPLEDSSAHQPPPPAAAPAAAVSNNNAPRPVDKRVRILAESQPSAVVERSSAEKPSLTYGLVQPVAEDLAATVSDAQAAVDDINADLTNERLSLVTQLRDLPIATLTTPTTTTLVSMSESQKDTQKVTHTQADGTTPPKSFDDQVAESIGSSPFLMFGSDPFAALASVVGGKVEGTDRDNKVEAAAAREPIQKEDKAAVGLSSLINTQPADAIHTGDSVGAPATRAPQADAQPLQASTPPPS